MSEDMDIYLQIADAIKRDVDSVIKYALSGMDKQYRFYDTEGISYIRWGLVFKDIHDIIDYHLTEDKEILNERN